MYGSEMEIEMEVFGKPLRFTDHARERMAEFGYDKRLVRRVLRDASIRTITTSKELKAEGRAIHDGVVVVYDENNDNGVVLVVTVMPQTEEPFTHEEEAS